MNIRIIFLISALCVLVGAAFPAQAAELFFETQNTGVAQSEFFSAKLFLATQDKDVNAISATVNIPVDSCALQSVLKDSSVFTLWVEEPKFENNRLRFSAIAPGGYQGERGLVLAITCAVKKQNNWSIDLTAVELLANDGLGTAIAVSKLPVKAWFSPEIFPSAPPEIIDDKVPPEDFRPVVVSYPDAWDGKWVVIFETKDKGSGLNHFEVGESGLWFMRPRVWEIATSPHVLKDQARSSFIFVKAIDNAGNERLVVVGPAMNKLGVVRLLGYSIIGLVALGFAIWFYVSRRKQK